MLMRGSKVKYLAESNWAYENGEIYEVMGYDRELDAWGTIKRAERKAVSPEVTAALITPKMVMTAITGVNQVLAMMPTIAGPPCPVVFTGLSGPKK